jgi:hypothetical protein
LLPGQHKQVFLQLNLSTTTKLNPWRGFPMEHNQSPSPVEEAKPSLEQAPAAQRPRKRKLLWMTGGAALLIVGSAAGASAFGLGGITSIAGRVSPMLEQAGINTGPYMSYVNQASQYLQIARGAFDAIKSGNIGGILSTAEMVMGELGLPDPYGTKQAAEQAALKAAKSQQGDSPLAGAQAEHTGNLAQNAAAQAVIQAALSPQGQAIASQQLQQVAMAGGRAQQLGTSAQKESASQKVLKAIAEQNGQMSGQLNSIYQAQQSTYMATQMGNASLLEIKQAQDRDRWQQQYNHALDQQVYGRNIDESMRMMDSLMSK